MQIAAGMVHSVVLLEDGVCQVYGGNELGQIKIDKSVLTSGKIKAV